MLSVIFVAMIHYTTGHTNSQLGPCQYHEGEQG